MFLDIKVDMDMTNTHPLATQLNAANRDLPMTTCA
jgi:hypothetical protein